MMINKRLLTTCKESKSYVKLTVFSSFIGLLANIIIIFSLGAFINTVITQLEYIQKMMTITEFMRLEVGSHLNVTVIFILIIVMLIIKFMSHKFKTYASFKASKNARQTLRELIFDKLLSLGLGYQDAERTSTIVQVSIEGVEQLDVYFSRYLPQLFYALLAPLTLFFFISFISLKVAVIFILCVPLIPISIITIMKIAKRILSEYWNNYANLGDTFLENLQGLTTLKAFNQDESYHEMMNVEAEGFRRITMKVLSMQLNSINVMDLIAFGGAAAGTIVGLMEFKQGHIQVGDLMIIILLSSEFFIPLRLLGSYFHIAMNGMAASDKIFNLIDTSPLEFGDVVLDSNLSSFTLSVDNLSFSYDDKHNVLRDVSLQFKPHELTAIVGVSGSGKSTLASLLVRQYKPSSGTVRLNDLNLNVIDSKSLYEHIGLVSAHSYIFKGTIRDNLKLANASASDTELLKALKVARLDEFVLSSKDGLNTLISEGGSSLSGGQKQRLALARVILANRPIIIFDEATSNIDVESEEAIIDAIYELKQSKTVILITHRLANIKNADSIYVLSDKTVVEHGTHEELMNQSSHYKTLVHSQQELEQIREVN